MVILDSMVLHANAGCKPLELLAGRRSRHEGAAQDARANLLTREAPHLH